MASFKSILAALRQFVGCEGHAPPSYSHVEEFEGGRLD